MVRPFPARAVTAHPFLRIAGKSWPPGPVAIPRLQCSASFARPGKMAEFRKGLRCLKNELAEKSEIVSETAKSKHLATASG